MGIKKYGDLTVLIAGCGSIANLHTEVLKSMGINKFILFDTFIEKAKELSSRIGKAKVVKSYEEGLELMPDAVYILTPTALHVPMAIKALEADCHVFIEKPLAASFDGVEKLKKLEQKSGKKVMVGFCFRFHPGIIYAKKLAESNTIGRIISIRALMGEHFPDMRPDYMDTYYVKYSGAFELIHDLDLAIWFAGSKMKSFNGYFGSFAGLGFKSPDTVEIMLEFEDRCLANVHLDFFQSPRRRQFELIGQNGTIIVEFAKWDRYTVSTFTRKAGKWDILEGNTTRKEMFDAESRAFLDSILYGRKIMCSVSESEKSLKVFWDLYGSKNTAV